MIGVQWDAISLATAFLIGAVFSAVVVLRLVRVIAEFLTRLGERPRGKDEHHDTDGDT